MTDTNNAAETMDVANLTANYVKNCRYIVSILPYYQANERTGTMVTYQNGKKEYYNGRCEFMIEQLAKVFHTSTKVARARAEAIIGKGAKRKPPLALRKDFCLVSFKCREVDDVKNDRTLGYVVLQYIHKVECLPNGDSLIIFYKGAPPLPVMQQRRSVIQQIKMAQIMQAQVELEEKHWENKNRRAAELLSQSPENWKDPLQEDSDEMLIIEDFKPPRKRRSKKKKE